MLVTSNIKTHGAAYAATIWTMVATMTEPDFIENNLGFKLSDSQKQLIERIQRGETIHYRQPRPHSRTRFFAGLAKHFGWKTTPTAPANGLHADHILVDEYVPETNTEGNHEKITTVAH